MKKGLLILAAVLLSQSAWSIGLTQTAIAITVLPTATLVASISGVQKEVLYKDGTEFVMQSELNAQAAAPSVALKEQLDQYIAKNSVQGMDYLTLTITLINAEAQNDAKVLGL